MIRSTKMFSVTLAALALSVSAGCSRAADDQVKANNAQAEADQKIAEAKNKATTETTGAQVEADKKIAAAEQDFGKRREDYRHKIQGDLVDLDKKIETLEADAKKKTGKAKTDLELNLKDIRARRAAFGSNMSAIETTTAVQWDSMKEKADADWKALKAAVDKAD